MYISIWDGNFGDDVLALPPSAAQAGIPAHGRAGRERKTAHYDLDRYFEEGLADGRLQKADRSTGLPTNWLLFDAKRRSSPPAGAS